MDEQKFKRGDRVRLSRIIQGGMFGVVSRVTRTKTWVTPDGHPDRVYKIPYLTPIEGRIERSNEPLPEADKPKGEPFNKGERVRFTHSKDGTMLGVIGTVSAARGTVQVVPDNSWTRQGHTYYTVNTTHPQPGKIERSDAPLPADCERPDDDPMSLAGFSAKVTGIMEGHDGYCYRLKVLKNGRDTKIEFFEEGHGGEVDYDTHGADPKVVAEFEAACEAWSTHYGVLGPYREHIKAWEVWQGHEFDLHLLMKEGKSLPNFPIGRFAKPEPWEFTFKEEDDEA